MPSIAEQYVRRLSCNGVIVIFLNILLLLLGIISMITSSEFRTMTNVIGIFIEIEMAERTFILMIIGGLIASIALIGILNTFTSLNSFVVYFFFF